MPLAYDISNYSGPATDQMIHDLQATQVSKVIVQSVNPPAPYPTTQTVQQITALKAAGFEVEAYIYLWNQWAEGVDRALDLLPAGGVSRVWLDVEDVSSPPTIEGIGTALGKIQARGYTTGIYTARWYWPSNFNFSSHPLWVAQYDGKANLDFTPFGNWTKCEMKQYTTEEPRAFGINYFGKSPLQVIAEKLRVLADEVEQL